MLIWPRNKIYTKELGKILCTFAFCGAICLFSHYILNSVSERKAKILKPHRSSKLTSCIVMHVRGTQKSNSSLFLLTSTKNRNKAWGHSFLVDFFLIFYILTQLEINFALWGSNYR